MENYVSVEEKTKVDMLGLASGNKNKKKIIRVGKGKGKESSRITFFDDPQPASTYSASTSTSDISSPTLNSSAPSDLLSAKSDQSLLVPSKRTDLHPRLIVSKVNVEDKKWTAGPSEIISGTSTDYTPRAPKVYVLSRRAAVEASVMEVDVDVLPSTNGVEALEVLDGSEGVMGWEGWPSIALVEKNWANWKVLQREDKKDGDWIAVKVRISMTPTPRICEVLLISFALVGFRTRSLDIRSDPFTQVRETHL